MTEMLQRSSAWPRFDLAQSRQVPDPTPGGAQRTAAAAHAQRDKQSALHCATPVEGERPPSATELRCHRRTLRSQKQPAVRGKAAVLPGAPGTLPRLHPFHEITIVGSNEFRIGKVRRPPHPIDGCLRPLARFNPDTTVLAQVVARLVRATSGGFAQVANSTSAWRHRACGSCCEHA